MATNIANIAYVIAGFVISRLLKIADQITITRLGDIRAEND